MSSRTIWDCAARPELKAILTKLKGKGPDAIFYGGMDSGAGPLLKQGRELGLKAVFVFGDGACGRLAARGLCAQCAACIRAAQST